MAKALPAGALPFIHPDDMPDQYALTAIGKCMLPLINDGAILVMDKRQHPEPGDTVTLVFTHEAAQRWGQPGMVKRLALALPPPTFPGGLVIVEQINPRRAYRIPSRDLLAVHRCVGVATPDPHDRTRARFRPQQEAPRC